MLNAPSALLRRCFCAFSFFFLSSWLLPFAFICFVQGLLSVLVSPCTSSCCSLSTQPNFMTNKQALDSGNIFLSLAPSNRKAAPPPKTECLDCARMASLCAGWCPLLIFLPTFWPRWCMMVLRLEIVVLFPPWQVAGLLLGVRGLVWGMASRPCQILRPITYEAA